MNRAAWLLPCQSQTEDVATSPSQKRRWPFDCLRSYDVEEDGGVSIDKEGSAQRMIDGSQEGGSDTWPRSIPLTAVICTGGGEGQYRAGRGVSYALGALCYLYNPLTKKEILKPEVVELIRKYAAAEGVNVTFSNMANAFLDKHVNQ
ncbi:hypothetical protein COCNU_scaffold002583G000020 [Cocos nucifera]|nr:hypothetical protein [Cocos nucifera]